LALTIPAVTEWSSPQGLPIYISIEFITIVHKNFNFNGVFNDVIIGQNIPVRADEKSCPLGSRTLFPFLVSGVSEKSPPEIIHGRVIKKVADPPFLDFICLDLDNRRTQIFNNGSKIQIELCLRRR
jgi:hypothetical protein